MKDINLTIGARVVFKKAHKNTTDYVKGFVGLEGVITAIPEGYNEKYLVTFENDIFKRLWLRSRYLEIVK